MTEGKNEISLVALRGMIASCAIEGPGHDEALYELDKLIRMFGPLRKVDAEETIKLLYQT